jgi:hypothetical protein
MRDRIPPLVRERVDKMGFNHPQATWFRTTLADRLDVLLHESSPEALGYLSADVVRADVARHRRGEIDVSGAMLRVAQLLLWVDGVLRAGAGETRQPLARPLPRAS